MITLPVRRARDFSAMKYLFGMSLFVMSAVLSSGTVGMICGAAGKYFRATLPPFYAPVAIFTAIGAVWYGLREVFGPKRQVPSWHWAIPQHWSGYGLLPYSLAFGSILGAGFFTWVPFIGYYFLLGACGLLASPVHGAAIMTLFGLARTLPLVMMPLVFRLRGRAYTQAQAAVAGQWIASINQSGVARVLRGVSLIAVAACVLGAIVAAQPPFVP